MISKMAMEDIDSLADEGIILTPQEVIRLNAFGLKVEKATDAAEQFALPRVAVLGDLTLRQPTIGSEIWMAQAAQIYETASLDTFMMLRIYSLSKKQDELLSPLDKAAMLQEMESLKSSLLPHTFDQISTALNFVVKGVNHFDGEAKANKKSNEDDDSEFDDEYSCIELGVLKNGLILKLGSMSELKGMTVSCLQMLVEYKTELEYGESSRKSEKNRRLIDYYNVLDEIREAHKEKAEKENG